MSDRGTQLLVLSDPAAAAADRLVSAAEAGAQIALAGGSTPRAAYEAAAASGADWSSATLWFGDERCVAPDHEQSNFRMVREALIERLDDDDGPTVRRMPGEEGPDRGAAAYEQALRSELPTGRLDLVLLGLGPDGHCASLFPGAPALEERDRPVVGVPEAGLEPFVPRITLTLPAINAAREVVFLATGKGKAEAVAQAFAGARDPVTPSSLVAPAEGSLVVLLDEAAASLLGPDRTGGAGT